MRSTRKLMRGVAIAACLPLAVTAVHFSDSTATASSPSSTVSWDGERQEIDGFGGAFAFHKAGSIQRLGEPLTSQILDMIFDKNTGIGLDIVRTVVGDGGTWGDPLYDGPAETIMPEQGVLVWDEPDWDEKKDDFDQYQVWLMREAMARGVDQIVATVWSPPAWMKQNNSVIGTGQNNRIRPDMYQEFADYLAEYVLGYKEHFGIDITHVSPTNEPDLGTSYSSSRWTPDELNVFVRDHLGPTFEARNIDAEIVVGEAVGFSDQWVRPALNDPQTVEYVDIVSAHAYTGLVQGQTAPNVNNWQLSNSLGKRIWQTEYMNNGSAIDGLFVRNTIDDGIRYATLIANMFDDVSLNGYFWWWPASNSGADGSNLIRLMNDGSPQRPTPTETGLYRVFKRYYAIGNYSRFIDPGWVMIDADKQPTDDVIVTAYKNPGTDQFAIVAVNRNPGTYAGARTVTFDLNDFPAGIETVVPYRTSANENLDTLDDVAVDDGSFTVELRGSSITTFVPKQHELPDLTDRKDVFSSYLAEENDGYSPGLEVRSLPDGTVTMSNIRHDTWIRYNSVNFGDGSAAGYLNQKGQLRMHARVASESGGTIEVRLGDPQSGVLVGEFEVPPGDPNEWTTVTTDIDTSPDGANGYHDMYLVFKNAPRHNIRMFTVDYFTFSD